MRLVRVEERVAEKIRVSVFIIVGILIYGSMVVFGIDAWLKCAILDINNSRIEDVLSSGKNDFSTVVVMYENEDFNIEGSSQNYNMSEVKEYIRVSNFVDSYYNDNIKCFVAPLTVSETRDIVLHFIFIDIVSLVVSVVMVVKCLNSKLLKRVLSTGLFIFDVVYSQFILGYTIDILYNVTKNIWLIFLGKVAILLFVLLMCSLVECSGEFTDEEIEVETLGSDVKGINSQSKKLSGGKYGIVRKVMKKRGRD